MGRTQTVVCAIVITVTITLCYIYQHQDAYWVSSHSRECVAETDQFKQVISRYLEARELGLEYSEIAQEVFKVNLPNAREEKELLHSFPFLSGNTLMARSDWVISTREVPSLNWSWIGFKPLYTGAYQWRKRGNKNRDMRDGDLIFVRSDEVEKFAKEVFPKLKVRIVLISHNSDSSVPKESNSLSMLEDPKLIHWFAQNAALAHTKLDPIPIGIMNQGHQDGSGQLEIWDKLLKRLLVEESVRDISLYVNISPRNRDWGWDQMRYKVFNALKNKPFSHVVGISEEHFNSSKPFSHYTKISSKQFLSDISRSKYVLSPPGIGEDCFRTWESVLLGAVPVVHKSTGLYKLWKVAPVLALDTMESLEKEDLQRWEIRKLGGREIALATYWFDKIDSVRRRYLK